jgi:hypothetical protein
MKTSTPTKTNNNEVRKTTIEADLHQVDSILKGLICLNEINHNPGLISDLEMIYCGYIKSQTPEEITGRDRERLMATFFDLLRVLKKTEGMSHNTFFSEASIALDFINDKKRFAEFQEFKASLDIN